MSRPTLLVGFILLLSAVGFADPPKTGAFEMNFSQRSPFSDLKTLTRRLKLPTKPAAPLADYDLSKEHFLVYVPSTYDAAKPLGLIVLAIYKHAEELPQAILPELDAANAALIVPKEYLDPWWQRAGVVLDAASNMKSLYAIDPHRIYVFGGGDWPDKDGTETMVASRVGLSFPEVFAGTCSTNAYPYRPVAAEEGGFYKVEMPPIDAQQFTMDKLRPFVLTLENDNPQVKLFFASYKKDGFQHVLTVPITSETLHYPNFQAGWLPGVLKFMDASTASLKIPVTASDTRPVSRPK